MGIVNLYAIGLGLMFVYCGTLKVVPINCVEKGHDEMMKTFERLAPVAPMKKLGLDLSPHMYCALFGLVEVISGVLVAFGRYHYRLLGALKLMCIMSLGTYSFYVLGYPTTEIIPPVAGVFLSFLVIIFRKGLTESTRPASGGKKKNK